MIVKTNKTPPFYFARTVVNIVTSVLFIFIGHAQAETIHLKSGQTITARIVERADDHIRVDLHGVKLTYYWDAIERIEGEGDPASLMPVITAEPVSLKENKVTVIPKDLREPVVGYGHPGGEIRVSDYVTMDYSPGVDPDFVIDPTHALKSLGLQADKNGAIGVDLSQSAEGRPAGRNAEMVNWAAMIVAGLGGFWVLFKITSFILNSLGR